MVIFKMDYCRPCGCKGRRSCLICEKEYNIEPYQFVSEDQKTKGYLFCHKCKKFWSGWYGDISKNCPEHNGKSIVVPGVFVLPDFINENEKQELLLGMNKEEWDPSQSGRRKQNYGPKCNFKKNKIQLGNFKGFPSYSKFVQDKFKAVPILKDFIVIEQCSLEYNPEKGASIDPHIDDCWIWGERVVTVNVLNDTYLTLKKYKGDSNKYNLDQVKLYPKILDCSGNLLESNQNIPFNVCQNNSENLENCDAILRVFMPEKSLIVLYGSARYEWEHFVLREDIKNLRICLAYREFTPPYLPGGVKEILSSDILNASQIYW